MAEGKVYLVGAGAGDPGLLTLRGQECLGMADLVLYDYLANPRLLRYCRKQAELICLGQHRRGLPGKESDGRPMPQDEVHSRMIEAAQAGQTVVRLKGGDPAIFGRLAEEIEALQTAGIQYEIIPAIVGEVVRHHVPHEWFASRPLFGRTVLITRPVHQAEPMIERLTHLGAEVVCQPAIQITPPANWDEVDLTIGRIGSFDWIVFSSTNGVQYFMNRVLETGHDLRILGNTRLAAIGPATAEALSPYCLRADLQPQEYHAEALAEALILETGTTGGVMGRILLIRANRGREYLAKTLAAAGAHVEQTVVYQSSDLPEPAPEVLQQMAAGQIDWAVATSSAIASSMLRQYGQTLRRTRVAAISPLTATIFSEAGYTQPTVASQYTTDGLIDAIVKAEGEG